MQFPDYHFPIYPHATVARQMFSNYGSRYLNRQSSGEFECQSVQPDACSEKAFPTVPLFSIPTKVPYPWEDRVMGEIIEKNNELESFVCRVSRIIGARKRSNKTQELDALMNTIENYKETPDEGYENMAMRIPEWFTKLLEQFEKIRDIKEPQTHNSRYAGGCLLGFQGDEFNQGLLLTPSGNNWDNITLYQLTEDSSGVIRSKVIGNKTVPGQIYEIRGQQVQSEKIISIRLDSSCLMYSVDVSDEDNPITFLGETSINSGFPTAISFSPYIPRECLIATDQGQGYLWNLDRYEEVIFSHPPRFTTEDTWRRCHFGSHPRQVIFSDPTMIQTYDLRESVSIGHDLLALPNKLLNQKERIRQCQSLSKCPFYQIIATDYSLLMVDERFPGHVVLKWDHMLLTPPQYISILDHVKDKDDSIVYVGSQVPDEVHGFRFRIRGDKPPQSVSVPWRVDRMRDVLKNPTVMEDISNVKALEARFDCSLAGIQVLPWRSGHIVFQLDSHGDIFCQLFREKDSSMAREESERPALQAAKEWFKELESQVIHSCKTGGRRVEKNVSDVFNEIHHLRPVNAACQLCFPSGTSQMGPDQADAFCHRCGFSLLEGKGLVEAVDKDRIRPSSTPITLPKHLIDVDKLPSASALSCLLLKQWNRDKNIENELKDWDQEVLEKRKHRRKRKIEQRTGRASTSTVSDVTEQPETRELEKSPHSDTCSCSGTAKEPESVETASDISASKDLAAVTVQRSLAVASGGQHEIANQETEQSSANQMEFSAANQDAESSPSVQEEEDLPHSEGVENSETVRDKALSRTPLGAVSSANFRNKASSSGIDSATSLSGGRYDSDSSLFSDSEITVSRKRRRHFSVSSSVSARSDISRVSVTSFPGFLESPKRMKTSQKTALVFSPSTNKSGKKVSNDILDRTDQTNTVEKDQFERLAHGSTEFSDIFSTPPSLFRSPVSAKHSPLNMHGRSPKLKHSITPSKIKKKSYQPGF